MYLQTNKKEECSGCGACMAVCSVGAISFKRIDGFLYPEIDNGRCLHCNKCTVICNSLESTKNDGNIHDSYYAWNTNSTIRKSSTSGGVFPALACAYLSKYPQASVYGAIYNDKFEVVHVGAESMDGVVPMCRSKYTQSDITDVFARIKHRLDEGKHVLFSGTPCQVAAIKGVFKNHENLFTMDFICHGVSNPEVFKKYINEIEEKYGSKVVEYSFRNKRKKIMSCTGKVVRIVFENGKSIETENDTFYLAYQEMLCYRNSCYACKFASSKRCADITVGDYWHIEEDISKLKKQRSEGISLILVNSEKGQRFVGELKKYCIMESGPYERALAGQMLSPIKYNLNSDTILLDKPISKQIRDSISIKKYLYYYFPRIYKILTKIWGTVKR